MKGLAESGIKFKTLWKHVEELKSGKLNPNYAEVPSWKIYQTLHPHRTSKCS